MIGNDDDGNILELRVVGNEFGVGPERCLVDSRIEVPGVIGSVPCLTIEKRDVEVCTTDAKVDARARRRVGRKVSAEVSILINGGTEWANRVHKQDEGYPITWSKSNPTTRTE